MKKLIILTFLFVGCQKKYTCTTITSYQPNPYSQGEKKPKDTSVSINVNWKTKRELNGQTIHTYGNGMITDSKTNCY